MNELQIVNNLFRKLIWIFFAGYTTVRGAKIRSVSLANTPVKKLQNKQNQQNQEDQNVNQPQTAELITGLQELVLINKNQNQQQ